VTGATGPTVFESGQLLRTDFPLVAGAVKFTATLTDDIGGAIIDWDNYKITGATFAVNFISNSEAEGGTGFISLRDLTGVETGIATFAISDIKKYSAQVPIASGPRLFLASANVGTATQLNIVFTGFEIDRTII
jgi:hypothetical protein